MRCWNRLLLGACLCGASLSASATITVVASYRLGEADPGAVAAGPGAATTVASIGGTNLPRTGAPVYSADVPPPIASTLSMAFNGTTDRYGGVPPVSTATDNFGIEAWVRSNGSTTANAALVYNGNSGSSGWGLFRAGAGWAFLYGGVTLQGGGAVTTAWTHLAVVRNAGTTTFYVNGQPVSTSAAAPNPPAGAFDIGGNSLNPAEFFDGRIDEVRVFTFAPGAFVPGDLNLRDFGRAVPVDGAVALVLLALAALVAGVFALGRRVAQ